MTRISRIIFGSSVLLGLAACETTNEDEWIGSGVKPFDQAEQSCEEMAGSIRIEETREEFFVACMAALGWTPEAPDPV